MEVIFWILVGLCVVIFIIPTLAFVIGRYFTKGYLSAKNPEPDSEPNNDDSDFRE